MNGKGGVVDGPSGDSEIREIVMRIEKRVEKLNGELAQVREELGRVRDEVKVLRSGVNSLEKAIERLNEQTNKIKDLQYALIGGTYGSLIAVILLLIRLLA